MTSNGDKNCVSDSLAEKEIENLIYVPETSVRNFTKGDAQSQVREH
jgi:hypothetical protein